MGRMVPFEILHPLNLTLSELDRSNFACARSAVASLVPLERRETQPFFWYEFEKNGESVLVHELCQVGSVFWGKRFALLEETTMIQCSTLSTQRNVTKFPCFWCLVFGAQFQHFWIFFCPFFC